MSGERRATFANIADWANRHCAEQSQPDRAELVVMIKQAAAGDIPIMYAANRSDMEKNRFITALARHVSGRILFNIANPEILPPYNEHSVRKEAISVTDALVRGVGRIDPRPKGSNPCSTSSDTG